MEIARSMLAGIIHAAARKVFGTMLGMDLTTGDSYGDHLAQPGEDGLVAFIGISGHWAGIGSLTCSTEQACQWYGRMLMAECSLINEEVLDVVAELTNMIIGNVKTDLERLLGPMGLSIPTVIFGKNFRMKSARKAEWTVVPFFFEGTRFSVRLCLAPAAEGAPLARAAIGQTCPLEL